MCPVCVFKVLFLLWTTKFVYIYMRCVITNFLIISFFSVRVCVCFAVFISSIKDICLVQILNLFLINTSSTKFTSPTFQQFQTTRHYKTKLEGRVVCFCASQKERRFGLFFFFVIMWSFVKQGDTTGYVRLLWYSCYFLKTKRLFTCGKLED